MSKNLIAKASVSINAPSEKVWNALVTPEAIKQYMATFPEDVQKRLEQVRATIHAAAPKAREKISYQIGAFELNGKDLIYFAGWKNHISIYPIPPAPRLSIK